MFAHQFEDLTRTPRYQHDIFQRRCRRGVGKLLEYGDATQDLARAHDPERGLGAVEIYLRHSDQTAHDLNEVIRSVALMEKNSSRRGVARGRRSGQDCCHIVTQPGEKRALKRTGMSDVLLSCEIHLSHLSAYALALTPCATRAIRVSRLLILQSVALVLLIQAIF